MQSNPKSTTTCSTTSTMFNDGDGNDSEVYDDLLDDVDNDGDGSDEDVTANGHRPRRSPQRTDRRRQRRKGAVESGYDDDLLDDVDHDGDGSDEGVTTDGPGGPPQNKRRRQKGADFSG